MSSYNKPNAAPVALTVNTASNAAIAVATPLAVRVGYRIYNSGANTIFVQELPRGAAVPTVAEVIAAPSFAIPAGLYIDSGARDLTDVYTGASATASGTFQELC
jgi:hypothetical protein